ncbi:MAG: response regulator transcription factor [Sandaracinaceae bacterium]
MPTPTRILIVDDSADDADIVARWLTTPQRYHCQSAPDLAQALDMLDGGRFDLVMLDLGLPDAAGGETVERVRAARSDVPIVVLTGDDGPGVAKVCFDAGADDYVPKSKWTNQRVLESVRFAISRPRQKALSQLLEEVRVLSSAGRTAPEAGRLAGEVPLSEREPELVAELIEQYTGLLEAYLESLLTTRPRPFRTMKYLVGQAAAHSASARDLLDIHVAVVERAQETAAPVRAEAILLESRLLAIEMMGLLVERYRSPIHRRWNQP